MINTDLLLIRMIEKDDFKYLYKIKNEPEVIFWEGHYFSFPYEKFERIYLEYFSREDILAKVVIEKSSNKIVGEVAIYPDWINKKAELGITISQEYWGKGYGSVVIKSITEYFLKKLLFVRVEAKILETNIGSLCAFKKAGFEQEGLLRKYKLHNGKYENMLIFSFINKEIKC